MHSTLTNTDALCCSALVRVWHLADIGVCAHPSAFDPKRTSGDYAAVGLRIPNALIARSFI
ncbi:MAG: hypothetical protein WBX78_21350, partial [Pseudolabrys sp.]